MSEAKTNLSDANDDTETHMRFSLEARIALALIVGLYAAARLWRLTDSCLWFDEIFSVHAARHTWGGLLRFVAADIIHPPLFYALVKIWIAAGGDSLLWLRLLPALAGIACVVPLVLLCRELRFNSFETNLSLLLMAASGYLIKYAQEVRMYSLLLLLALISLWLFARLTNDARTKMKWTLVALFFVNLFLIYTHYYGWLLVATQIIFVAVKKRDLLLRFSSMVALLFVSFAPWVYALTVAERGRGVEQNLGWITRPRAADVPAFYALLHEPFYFRQSSDEPLYLRLSNWAALVVFVLPLALLAWRLWRRGREGNATREREIIAWLVVFSFVPAVLAFALAWALPQSVWGTRHLIIVAAPYLLLAALALARVRPRWLRAALLVIMSCWFIWGAFVAHTRGDGRYIWCAWENLAAEMRRAEPAASRDVQVYAFEDLVAYHLWFALDAARDERFKVSVVKGVGGLAEDPAYFLPRAFDGVRVADAASLEGEQFWLAFRAANWDESRPPLKILKERGYYFADIREFDAQGQRAFMVSVRR